MNNLDWLQEIKPEDIRVMTLDKLLRLNRALIDAYDAQNRFCVTHIIEQKQRIGELQAEIEKLRGARPKEYEGC